MATETVQSGTAIVATAGASGALSPRPSTLIGFACTVTGTLSLFDGADANSPPVLTAFPVTAGQFVFLPFQFRTAGFFALTSAAGSFSVGD